MKRPLLYSAWGILYALCIVLGFVPNPAGFGKVLLVLTSLICFLPAVLLVLSAHSRRALRPIRVISLCSLGLTLALLVANFLSVQASPALGRVLYVLLALVSAPMFCSQYWVLSIFLWACLLMGTFAKRKLLP